MKYSHTLFVVVCLWVLAGSSFAANKIELDTTVIKGNKELPQILYVVPWKEMKPDTNKEQTLVLHSLFGDLFDPVYPDATNISR
jgi:hypothetical protein